MTSQRLRKLGPYLIAFAIAAVAVGWVASGELLGDGDPEASKAPAQLSNAREVPMVRVRHLQAEPHADVLSVQGRTAAQRVVVLRSETHGPIEEILVDKGARVEAGQTLARIAPHDRPARLTEAQALVEQRRIELSAAEELSERGHRAQTQVAAARAAWEQAQALLRQAEVALRTTEIRAPFAAIVDDRMVEDGDYLQDGSEVLRLIELDPLKVVGSVNEQQIGALRTGMPARVRLISGESAEGEISFIAAESRDATRTFRVEVSVPNPEGRLRAGVTAQIAFPLEERPAHLITSSVLALSDDGILGVKLVDTEDRVTFHPVEILRDTSRGMWVSGLPEEVSLITVGQEFVDAGQHVRPVTESEVEAAMQETRAILPAGVNNARPSPGYSPGGSLEESGR